MAQDTKSYAKELVNGIFPKNEVWWYFYEIMKSLKKVKHKKLSTSIEKELLTKKVHFKKIHFLNSNGYTKVVKILKEWLLKKNYTWNFY